VRTNLIDGLEQPYSPDGPSRTDNDDCEKRMLNAEAPERLRQLPGPL
jgi:hypothetical protein